MDLCHLWHLFYRNNIYITNILLIFNVNFCELLPKNSGQLGVSVSITHKDFSCAGELHSGICYVYVWRRYCSSLQILMCFCWQWTVVAIKHCKIFRLLVLCFQMFYILICQITIWWISEPLNFIQQDPTITDNVFGWSFWRYCVAC